MIYDRIRENRERHPDADLASVVNRSLNETLSRTLLTAGTTLLALLALLAFGGPELRGFAAAMTVGVVVGTWSSVYVAFPLLILLERRAGSAGGRRDRRRPSDYDVATSTAAIRTVSGAPRRR